MNVIPWSISIILALALAITLLIRPRRRTDVHWKYALSQSDSSFSEKVVFISGGTSGIGLATAIAFAAANAAHVVVCGRQWSKWETVALPKIASSLPLHQQGVIEYAQADVRVYEQINDVIQTIVKKYGRLDIAFNNAGVAVGAPVAQQTLSSVARKSKSDALSFDISGPQPWSPLSGTGTDAGGCADPSETTPSSPWCENAIFTDGLGVWNCIKAELQVMVKQLPSADPPTIINTASVNSIWGSPGAVFYGAAKAMVHLLTKGVAVEEAISSPMPTFPNLPIRVNCVMPSAVYTPLLADQISPGASYNEVNKVAKAGIPMGRIAFPEEIASVVLFLADNARASYVTGSSVIVDGGLTAAPVLGAG